jgi:hypothetical protein
VKHKSGGQSDTQMSLEQAKRLREAVDEAAKQGRNFKFTTDEKALRNAEKQKRYQDKKRQEKKEGK